MQECKKCHTIKPLKDFYKHPKMSNGYDTTCKECIKERTKARYRELKLNPTWIEKERSRGREKYYRLGYRDKHKSTPEQKKVIMQRYKSKYPEKDKSRSLSSHIRAKCGYNYHHWCYKEENAKDVIILTIAEHNTLHRFLVYNQPELCYETLEGELLDTKEKHLEYFNKINLDINTKKS